MSTISRAKDRAKNGKRPSPESGRRRLRGKLSKAKPVYLPEYWKSVFRAKPKTLGAFGGCTRCERKARQEQKGGAK